MENSLTYTSIEYQIQKLKDQHLVITNEQFAYTQLEMCGYSNVIKGYRDPYVIKKTGACVYRSDVSFEQVFSLYLLDKNLRNGVMAAMQDLEEHIKAAASDVISKSFGVDPVEYLKYRNYRNKRKRVPRFALNGILDSLNHSLKSGKDPVKHYREVHGTVPPWILFKNIYFSTVVNFIDLFKADQLNDMVCHLYSDISDVASFPVLRSLMMGTLFMCLEYRNLAAHGARIYNHTPDVAPFISWFESEGELPSPTGFSLLLYMLSLFKYRNPYERLHETIDHEVNRHCSRFPEDSTYLGQTLNLDIVKSSMAYASPNGRLIHLDPRCSGMIGAVKLDLDEALKSDMTPCKKCFK